MRGVLVRLTDAWTEILRRRAAGAYPLPVQNLLGEMVAAACLMQSNIKFNGALVLQIFGDGPVRLAVAEVQSDFALRATATVIGEVAPDASLSALVNLNTSCQSSLRFETRKERSLAFATLRGLMGCAPCSVNTRRVAEIFCRLLGTTHF